MLERAKILGEMAFSLLCPINYWDKYADEEIETILYCTETRIKELRRLMKKSKEEVA
jgi:hypothetical protein